MALCLSFLRLAAENSSCVLLVQLFRVRCTSSITTAATSASQGSNNKLGLSDKEYTRYFYFDTDLTTGKGIYFPPADAPVEEKKAWYEQISKLSGGERAVYSMQKISID